jgi:hypothetical protein
MAKTGAFEPVLSARATAFLVSLSKPKQRRLIDLIYRLSDHPQQLGDYTLTDDTGRNVQFLIVGDLVVGFWPDHAVKELRITEIDEV